MEDFLQRKKGKRRKLKAREVLQEAQKRAEHNAADIVARVTALNAKRGEGRQPRGMEKEE